MSAYREIRAQYDASTITVYQAFNSAIADAALEAQRFTAPFSLNRMTWIKPSFLWMMERSGWGAKPNQERVLAIRLARKSWERALSLGVLSSFDPSIHASPDEWRRRFANAEVHVQWDPERSIRGRKLEFRTIQVGIGRTQIGNYVSSWVQSIEDVSPLVGKLRAMRIAGKHTEAKRLLPVERVYEVPAEIGRPLGVEPGD